MRSFLLWGWAVIRHWIAILGGGSVSVALLVWANYGPSTNRLPEMMWWTGIACGFIVACYLAWRDEMTAVERLKTQLDERFPRFVVGIQQMSYGRTQGSLDGVSETLITYMAPIVSILNLGAPSVVKSLQCIVRHPDGTESAGQQMLPPDVLPPAVGQPQQPIPFGSPLIDRVVASPIERGAVVVGRVFFVFLDMTPEMISGPGTVYEIRVHDAWFPETKEHSVTVPWTAAKPSKLMTTFVGSGVKTPTLPAKKKKKNTKR
jgi:hypothetical protein